MYNKHNSFWGRKIHHSSACTLSSKCRKCGREVAFLVKSIKGPNRECTGEAGLLAQSPHRFVRYSIVRVITVGSLEHSSTI